MVVMLSRDNVSLINDSKYYLGYSDDKSEALFDYASTDVMYAPLEKYDPSDTYVYAIDKRASPMQSDIFTYCLEADIKEEPIISPRVTAVLLKEVSYKEGMIYIKSQKNGKI
jgi:hypothetical protein